MIRGTWHVCTTAACRCGLSSRRFPEVLPTSCKLRTKLARTAPRTGSEQANAVCRGRSTHTRNIAWNNMHRYTRAPGNATTNVLHPPTRTRVFERVAAHTSEAPATPRATCGGRLTKQFLVLTSRTMARTIVRNRQTARRPLLLIVSNGVKPDFFLSAGDLRRSSEQRVS